MKNIEFKVTAAKNELTSSQSHRFLIILSPDSGQKSQKTSRVKEQ